MAEAVKAATYRSLLQEVERLLEPERVGRGDQAGASRWAARGSGVSRAVGRDRLYCRPGVVGDCPWGGSAPGCGAVREGV